MSGGKTKTKQTNKPIYSGQIEGAARGIDTAYQQQLPAINDFSQQLTDVSQGLFDQYAEGGGATGAAQDYITNTLSGDITQNPYLDDIVSDTNDSLMRQIRTQMGTRGGLGGSSELGILGDALSSNELNLRYQDYDNQMGYRQNAAGMAPSIEAASYLPLDIAQQLGQTGALLPLNAANARGAGVGGLLGQYQDVEGEQRQTMGFADWAGLGLQAASMFSDRRLKTDIKRVGQTDAGTPVYTYRYGGQGPFQMGVMADEVPNARGPDVQGYATVRYEEVA